MNIKYEKRALNVTNNYYTKAIVGIQGAPTNFSGSCFSTKNFLVDFYYFCKNEKMQKLFL